LPGLKEAAIMYVHHTISFISNRFSQLFFSNRQVLRSVRLALSTVAYTLTIRDFNSLSQQMFHV